MNSHRSLRRIVEGIRFIGFVGHRVACHNRPFFLSKLPMSVIGKQLISPPHHAPCTGYARLTTVVSHDQTIERTGRARVGPCLGRRGAHHPPYGRFSSCGKRRRAPVAAGKPQYSARVHHPVRFHQGADCRPGPLPDPGSPGGFELLRGAKCSPAAEKPDQYL